VKHVIHLFAWDVRRLRVLLVIWLLAVIAEGAMTGLRPFVSVDPSLREWTAVVASLLWLTTIVLGFAMVSLVVHGHPTVGSNAFWMTRAIPPRALFASKLLLLALVLVVVPAMIDAFLLIAHRVPLPISSGVVAQNVTLRTVLAILLMIGAVMTLNLPRFAFLCGAALFTLAVAMALLMAMTLANPTDDPPVRTDERSDDPTALIVFNVLFVATAVVTLAVQYRTRLRRRSVPVGVAGAVIAAFIASEWPAPFLRPRLIVPAWAYQPQALVVSVEPDTISTNARHVYFPDRASEWSTVNGRVNIAGVETGWVADMALREATLELANGTTLRSPAGWRTSVLVAGSGYVQPRAIVRDVLGVEQLFEATPREPEPPPSNLPILFSIRQRELSQHAPARGRYRGRLNVHLTHYGIAGVMPLAPGSMHHHGGYRLVIDRIAQPGGEVAVIARESRASSMWERRPWAAHSFYLRNRERGQAVAVSDYELQGGFSLWRVLPIGDFSVGTSHQGSGFFTRGVVMSIPPRYNPRAETLDVDQAWLAGAELVIVRRTEEGWVERTVEIPDFPIGQ
jgi:multisubunit Na+/H+ antiporter MnhC subunit